MNNEESRLRTFVMWPTDAAVDAARIAKAGFFYTGQGLEVQCFSCGGKITEWNYGDQVMAKHRRLDPRCPFVVNPSSSGNVPKIHPSTSLHSTALLSDSGPRRAECLMYRTESSRLATFERWPAAGVVHPEDLAKAGFYSLQESDKVKCAFCGGVAGFWEAGDDPRAEHRRHFPDCPFVRANFCPAQDPPAEAQNGRIFSLDPSEAPPTEISVSDSNTKLVTVDNLQELGIQAHKGPRQARFATLESRLRTFGNWSPDLIQTPEMLAEAGFYYVGTGDQVRCFHCDGGLRHWDPEDQPWVEHARWFPSCAFVRLIKGQEFIQGCNPEQLPHNSLNLNLPQTARRSPEVRQVSDQELQSYMSSAPALAALSVGLHVGRVKLAIRQKLEQTGTDYSSPDALIEAALNLQLQETETLSDGDSEDVQNILSAVIVHSNDKEEAESAGTEPTEKPTEEKSAEVQNIEAKSEGENLKPKLSLEEENRQLKEARLCKICMDQEIGVVFLPCGHLTTCVNCAPSLKDCPVCRSVIKGTVRTFLS